MAVRTLAEERDVVQRASEETLDLKQHRVKTIAQAGFAEAQLTTEPRQFRGPMRAIGAEQTIEKGHSWREPHLIGIDPATTDQVETGVPRDRRAAAKQFA